MVVQAVDREEGCPDCSVVSARMHAWTRQRVKNIGAGGADTPAAGRVELVMNEPGTACAERACGRRTFTPATDQLPPGPGACLGLRTALQDAVVASGRAADEVAGRSGWPGGRACPRR